MSEPQICEPQISLREAQLYLGIRAPVTHGIRDFADSAFPELFGWLFENGVAPAGPPFLRYHEVNHTGEPLDAEAGVPVDRAGGPPDAEAGAPVEGATGAGNGRVRFDALPAGRYLTSRHVGPYTSDAMPDLGDARAELVAWARDNGIVYGSETERGLRFPCALEQFLVGPADDPDFTKWQTEFAYLIR
jgi:effector-binding domain-containing protein